MKLDLYDKIFSESKNKKELLYFDKYNSDIAFCGYVLSYNSEVVQIQHYTKYGKDDGVVNLQYSDISYIVTDNEYLKSMQYIIDNNTAIDINKNGVLPLDSKSNWKIQILKEYRKDKSTILGIEIDGGWYLGFINELDDLFFSFIELDKNGEILDTSIYKLSDVTNIHINELEGRKRLLLYNWRESRSEK